MKRLLSLTLMLLLLTGAAHARDLTAEERTALDAKVAAFDAAMRASDYEGVVDVIAPRVMSHIATGAGIDVATLRPIVVQQMQAALAAVKLESFSMDMAKTEDRELADGTPYVLIPTETVMDPGDGNRIAMRSHTLALMDEGKWYLMRVSDAQQLTILRQVYPDYAGVEFPAGSMEALKD